MLDQPKIDNALQAGRRLALRLVTKVQKGEMARSEALNLAHATHDALVCLLDEAPESEHGAITYLIDRFEALMRGWRS